MKTKMIFLMAACLTLTFLPLQSMASSKTTTPNGNVMPINPEAKELTNRLYEIKEMDKSDLSRSEKKALRQEVRDIKNDANFKSGGIYISAAGIIIILLLLILIL